MPSDIGASSVTVSLAVRASAPKPNAPPTERVRGKRDAERAHGEGAEDAERDAEEPAGRALGQRLADHLADDEPLPPAERLERAELADPLARPRRA